MSTDEAAQPGWCFLPVTRREEDLGGGRSMRYPDPPLDPDWDEFTRVQWQVSLAAFDSGLPLSASRTSEAAADEPAKYTLHYSSGYRTGCTHDRLLSFLSGVVLGAEQARLLDDLDRPHVRARRSR